MFQQQTTQCKLTNPNPAPTKLGEVQSEVYLFVGSQRISSPNLDDILSEIGNQALELIFVSETRHSSLILQKVQEIGVAFGFCMYDRITVNAFFYEATGPGDTWVTVRGDDSLELTKFYDGQDYTWQPIEFFVEDDRVERIVADFVRTGTKSDCVEWALEKEIIERMGSKGCFDQID